MEKYNGQAIVKFDGSNGNAAVGVEVTVINNSTGAPAILYKDNDTSGTTLSNPLTTNPNGRYSFFAQNGNYTISFNSGDPDIIATLFDPASGLGGLSAINFKTVLDAKGGISSGGKLVSLQINDVIMIEERDARFAVVDSSTVTANDMDIISSLSTSISYQLLNPSGNLRQLGLKSGLTANPFISKSFELSNKAILNPNSFDVNLSSSVNIPEGCHLDLGGNDCVKNVGFSESSIGTIFTHTGDGGVVERVGMSGISSDQWLIGYSSSDNCTEVSCTTGRGLGNLIKLQSERNNNNSFSLSSAALFGKVVTEKTIKAKVDSTAGGAVDFRRVRFFPSYARITAIKVTDLGGSPDFYFDLAMREGASFSYPFIRARSSSDISDVVNIDWLYDSSDDLLSFTIRDYNGTSGEFEVEISYVNEFFASESVVWAWQSELDFLRPHAYGSTSKTEAIRSPEYRSYITGTGLDVRVASTGRNKDANYNLPNVTMPTPAGTQDLTEPSEIKFYFRLGGAEALSVGATHAVFRLYQSNRQIKCTVINGFLAQAPDWAPETHLATALQDDIEVDWAAHSDRDNPIELLIPLDHKTMQKASAQSEKNDFNYYYLTFFANLPGHVAIEWGDVWEWDFRFIRQ